jgi:hypothetical protein
VPEALAQEITRLRTLDQTLENSGGMSARFFEREDAARQATQGNRDSTVLYRSIDENFGGSGERARRSRTDGSDDNPAYRTLTLDPVDDYAGVPETVQNGFARPPGVYDASARDREEGVRRGLGLGSQNPAYR